MNIITSDGTQSSNPPEGAYAKFAFKDGVRYFEVKTLVVSTSGDAGFGSGLASFPTGIVKQGDTYSSRHIWFNLTNYNDFYNNESKDVPGFGPSFNHVGDVVGIVANFNDGTVGFYLNGVFVRNGPFTLTAGTYYSPLIQFFDVQPCSVEFNGGDRPFAYAIPAGAVAWNTDIPTFPLVRRSISYGTISSDFLTYTSQGGIIPTDEKVYYERALNAGVKFFEVTVVESNTTNDNGFGIGICSTSGPFVQDGEGAGTGDTGRHNWFSLGTYNDYYNDGSKDGPGFGGGGGAINVNGTVVGVGVNFDAGTLSFYKNGVFVNNAPYTLVPGVFYVPMFQIVSNPEVKFTFNGGDTAFAYPVSGFTAWAKDASPITTEGGDNLTTEDGNTLIIEG